MTNASNEIERQTLKSLQLLSRLQQNLFLALDHLKLFHLEWYASAKDNHPLDTKYIQTDTPKGKRNST